MTPPTTQLTPGILEEIGEAWSAAMVSSNRGDYYHALFLELCFIHLPALLATARRVQEVEVEKDKAKSLLLAAHMITVELRTQLSAAQAEIEKLKPVLKFAGAILIAHRGDGPGEIGDVDGGTLQDLCIEHGLIEPRRVTEMCCDSCTCGPFPAHCYFESTLGGLARLAAMPEPPSKPLPAAPEQKD